MNLTRSFVSVIGLGLLVGCNMSIPQYWATRDFDKTIETQGQVNVTVETYNGSIEVTPSETQELQIHAVVKSYAESQSEADSRLDSLMPQIEQGGESIKIKAEKHSNGMFNMDSVNFVLKVPANYPLTLKSSNGRVASTGARAAIEIKTSNGAVSVKNATGKFNVETSNGAIEISESMGSMTAKTSNGAIKLKDCVLDADSRLKTSNGAIEAIFASSQNVLVDASTSNGSVKCEAKNLDVTEQSTNKFKGTVRGENSSKTLRLDLETSNGRVSIKASDRANDAPVSTTKETQSATE